MKDTPTETMTKVDSITTYIELYIELIDQIGRCFLTDKKKAKELRYRLYKTAQRALGELCQK